VRVPDEVGSGLAKIRLSFSSWLEGNVAPAVTDLPITAFTVRESEQLRMTLPGHSDRVGCVAYSPDGKILASSSIQGTVKWWNSATGQILTPLPVPSSSVYSVAFAPDGKTLAVAVFKQTGAGVSGEIRSYDVATGKLQATLKREPALGVSKLTFSPDGKTLAAEESFSSRGRREMEPELVIWDMPSQQVRATLKTAGAPFVFSPDGKNLVTGGRRIQVRDVGSGQESASMAGSCACLAYSPDGQFLAGGDFLGKITLWDTARLEIAGTVQLDDRPRIYSIAFSPDGKMLAAGMGDRDPKVIKPADVVLVDVSTLEKRIALQGHRGPVHSLAFSPDGKLLASGSEDRTVRIWDLQKSAASKE
jgi:WD40 repeat protein